VARDGGGATVAGKREDQVARDPGAGAASFSTRRVRFLEEVAGVQKRGPPLAYTARSGVESQQHDAWAESVLSWSWCGAVNQRTTWPVQRTTWWYVNKGPGSPCSSPIPGRKRFLCQLPLGFYIY
jgi:hypothetical protein